MKLRFVFAVVVTASVLAGCDKTPSVSNTSAKVAEASLAPLDYQPLALAKATAGQIANQEAVIPPQCYTKTDGQFNPCWACHVNNTPLTTPRNHKADWQLQAEYAFSDLGLTNHWANLFEDFSPVVDAIADAQMLDYIREDNYTAFRAAMQAEQNYAGWVPDIDLHAGFDDQGFAVDGSWWRSFRYKPFLGTFFPTNGATDDIMIRLPKRFYTDANGNVSKEIYKINLAIVEASMTSGGRLDAQVNRTVEPLDETLVELDLNGDGAIIAGVTQINGLPEYYVGQARDYPVKKNLYPKNTEFLHTVRYLDPETDNWLSKRIKEVRYSIKHRETDRWKISRYYELEADHKDEEILPLFDGNGVAGMRNEIGWKLQGFIEDEQGRLRAQTDQEHYYCMGCHSNIGVTADQTFGFPRKVPGQHGWGEVNIAGIPDVPQVGHTQPEIFTYFLRNGGGDEFRNNQEILDKFFSDGELQTDNVLEASTSGDKDIRHLILPSEERAYALNKAYMALVQKQRFDLGRDPMLSMPSNVHKEIVEVDAGLSDETIYRDGTLWLDWSNTHFVEPQGAERAAAQIKAQTTAKGQP